MKKHLLEVDSIIKSFGVANVLTDVYLKCETGDVVGILGRNGSGKSTLLKIIFGTVNTDNKSIRIDGKTHQFTFKENTPIAYLSQDSFLPKNVRIKKLIKNFIFDKVIQEELASDDRIIGLLNKTCAELSGGERRLFELMLLISLPVKFVLLDEPFAAIEPLYKEKIKKLINEKRAEKGFIITDHDYSNIIEASDRIILITNGVCKPINELIQLEKYNYLPKGALDSKREKAQNQEIENNAFAIDEQTLNDLELKSSKYSDSILSIFESKKSKGAYIKLNEIVSSPLTNQALLEDRRDAIQFIQEEQLEFDFDSKQLDFIAHYHNSGVNYSNMNVVDSFVYRLKNKYRPTNDYYILSTGVQHTIHFLKYLNTISEHTEKLKLPPYLSERVFKIQEIINQREIREMLLQYSFRTSLLVNIGQIDFLFRKTMKDEMLLLIDMYYELEVYQIVANTSSRYEFCYPEYSSKSIPNIELEGLFHPKLTNPVSNNFEINNISNVCFLTGANMSGKSTFIKSFGLAIYFAHLGFPVPASSMSTTVFNGLVTTINLSDDINNGYSHFYTEVKRVKEAALQVSNCKNMIVIFDELFRGTNVKDASEASLLITSAFAKIRHSLFMVSTHIVEIADELKQQPNVFFNCFETTLENETPVYSYKLNEGVSKESHGLLIVKNEKIAEILEGN